MAPPNVCGRLFFFPKRRLLGACKKLSSAIYISPAEMNSVTRSTLLTAAFFLPWQILALSCRRAFSSYYTKSAGFFNANC
ncbi:hypothetical protein DWY69_15925 [Eisenbergiella massiliensis]|uniref:Uncharacterized protein n=1 Tax=Eisenbergiella massiliensis TaxID=1720294 RepID=A0A3E3HVE7_9FIRM|nr:hypothetical protein DXC51_27420 [Eisenbergiella massiliensis]RGE70702.1 hypothetical protein DWY69_15925 [Eisenbergiella massiliensis]